MSTGRAIWRVIFNHRRRRRRRMRCEDP